MRSVWGHITVRIEIEKKTVHSGYFQPMASRLRASFCREVNFTDQCHAKLILEIRRKKYRPCQAGFLRIEVDKPREKRRWAGLFFSASCWPENLNDLVRMVSTFLRIHRKRSASATPKTTYDRLDGLTRCRMSPLEISHHIFYNAQNSLIIESPHLGIFWFLSMPKTTQIFGWKSITAKVISFSVLF